ncbi:MULTISPECIES: helix-turn-helix domain-containing protein [unclassified Streptomyces]|uniref:helix-turn-helix domain-containing protein n=1 Tax=unclassified Streptomyces TaxID=2593676 RepID=UPI000DAD0B1A|nr:MULTISPECIES: helix-turn-helix transcriptional regulator [unclassified Streptomyces]PZT76799.1 Secondary metabolite protein [Streptomyces sp. AC1-42W]PZT79247.1 Secondary metabolite protein [Streptomyces sp. AC1-42T]
MTGKEERSFAELLDHLVREVHPAGRGPYTYAELSQGIREATGVSISASAIQQLRRGTNRNPKMQTIRALAAFFGVPPGYFFDEEEAERQRAEIRLVATMRDQNVLRVALRADGLSTSSLNMVSTVIEQARRLEGVPESDTLDLLDDE